MKKNIKEPLPLELGSAIKRKPVSRRVSSIQRVYNHWTSEEAIKGKKLHDGFRTLFHKCCTSKFVTSRFLLNRHHLVVLARIPRGEKPNAIYTFINEFLIFFTCNYSIMWQLEKYDESTPANTHTIIHFIMVKRSSFDVVLGPYDHLYFDPFADWSNDLKAEMDTLKKQVELFETDVYSVGHLRILDKLTFDFTAVPFEFFRFYFINRVSWVDWNRKASEEYVFGTWKLFCSTSIFGFDQELHRRLAIEANLLNAMYLLK